MHTVQRAFELAATGNYRSLEHIKIIMRRERLDSVDAHLAGGTIKRQLMNVIRNAGMRT
jgi:hypothetical protein